MSGRSQLRDRDHVTMLAWKTASQHHDRKTSGRLFISSGKHENTTGSLLSSERRHVETHSTLLVLF